MQTCVVCSGAKPIRPHKDDKMMTRLQDDKMMTRAAMRKEKDRLAVQNMASLYYAILYSADCVVVGSFAKPGRPTHTVYYTL